jgi:hypothetical protein
MLFDEAPLIGIGALYSSAMPETPEDECPGVRLKLKMAFPSVLHLGRPWISIDGTFTQPASWGLEFMPVPLGRHTIQCGVELIGGIRVVSRVFDFEVVAGDIATLQWTAPLLLGLRGRWTVQHVS